MENYTDISKINTSKLTTEEKYSFGNKDKLIISSEGKKLCQFYFNMRGYNQDFSLKNKDNVSFIFGGDKSKAMQLTALKKAIKEGYTFIKQY